MDEEMQTAWMQGQVVALVERAANNDVGAYVIYGQLLAGAVGVGDQLDEDLKEKIHDSIEEEMDYDLSFIESDE